MNAHKSCLGGVAAAALLLLPAAASAQQPGGSGATLLQELERCRAIGDGPARLACFDAAAGALLAARERKDVTLVDRQEVQRTRRSLFGFTLPRLSLFGSEKEEVRELDAVIMRVAALPDDRWSMVIEDAEWRTTEPSYRAPAAGDAIHIKRAALGSYIGTFGRTSVRMTRVR